MRITIKKLEEKTKELNRLLGTPSIGWDNEAKKANVGHYYIESVFGGGCKLQCVANEKGNVTLLRHFTTNKEAWEYLEGLIMGIYIQKI